MSELSRAVWPWAVTHAAALGRGYLPVAMRADADLFALVASYALALLWLLNRGQRIRARRNRGLWYAAAVACRIAWRPLSLIVMVTFGLLVALARSEGRATYSSWRRF